MAMMHALVWYYQRHPGIKLGQKAIKILFYVRCHVHSNLDFGQIIISEPK